MSNKINVLYNFNIATMKTINIELNHSKLTTDTMCSIVLV